MHLAILVTVLILSVVYAGLIFYYYRSWISIPAFVPQAGPTAAIKISVIIPARNEERNIAACLDAIYDNDYSKDLFEVIVVDDHSEDATALIVKGYPAKNIRLIALQDHVEGNINSYKKKAIEVAVAQAQGELIVTTDADCIVPAKWLQVIAAFYKKNDAAFIAAPVVINNSRRFIEIFQALDFMTLQGITGAAVHKGLHAMCNGANLAYKRTAFYEVDGFEGIDDIASGDDMLLMYKISQHYTGKVFFLRSQEAVVQTAPVQTIAQFFNQRIRWASKADKYDDKSILPVLFAVYLFNVLLLAMPLVALFDNFHCTVFSIQFSLIAVWLAVLCFKTIVELIFLLPVAVFFNKQKLLWWFPIMQPFHILYTVTAGFLGKFGNYKWKERKVK